VFLYKKRFSKVLLNIMSQSKGDVSTKSGSSYIMGGLSIVFIVLILLLIMGTCTETGKKYAEKFKNTIMPTKKNLKELDIIMFMSPTCPWCMKTIEMLENEKQINNLTIVDVSKEEGKAMAKEYGADKVPVPSFISRALKTSTYGYRETVDKLLKDLQIKKGSEPGSSDEPVVKIPTDGKNIDINLIQELQIVLFAREGCPWCVKAKEHCKQEGIVDMIKVIDITSPEGQQAASELLPPGSSGVPAWVSMASKKSVIGFKPIDQLIKELQ
jgi:glutaredoxin